MFKIGDMVVCINNTQSESGVGNNMKGLTYGKVYVINEVSRYPLIKIINDYHERGHYLVERFISFEEVRRTKIEKICSRLGTL